MMAQSICPAAIFCPFWIFIILLILYLVFFVIWIWILIGSQWLGTGHKHKRFDESAKNDRLIHLLGGHIRITKSLILISWIFFIFTIILVILVGHIFEINDPAIDSDQKSTVQMDEIAQSRRPRDRKRTGFSTVQFDT